MSGSVNKAIVVGHVGKDPEIRKTRDDKKIASFSMATSETWRDKATGERKERTEWHRIVVFNDSLAKVVEQYVKKGSKLYVEGQMASRKYNDKSGIEREIKEIVLQGFYGTLTLLDSRGSTRPPAADDPDAYGTTSTRETGQTPTETQRFGDTVDDDIPL